PLSQQDSQRAHDGSAEEHQAAELFASWDTRERSQSGATQYTQYANVLMRSAFEAIQDIAGDLAGLRHDGLRLLAAEPPRKRRVVQPERPLDAGRVEHLGA